MSDINELPKPEPPEKCPQCGQSIYLNDRNDDYVCDTCFADDQAVLEEKKRQWDEWLIKTGIPL